MGFLDDMPDEEPNLPHYGKPNGGAAAGRGGSDSLSEISMNSLLALPQNKWRAKLYQLNGQGSWDDFGTGDFQIVKDVSQNYPPAALAGWGTLAYE